MKKLVVLEGIKLGNKFISTTDEGDDPTKLNDGTVAYRVLGIFEDDEAGMKEAQRACGMGISREKDIEVLSSYLRSVPFTTMSKEDCDALAASLVAHDRRIY